MDSFEGQYPYYATALGGGANNTAQICNLSANGPVTGYDQVVRDINTLYVNISKLFAAKYQVH